MRVSVLDGVGAALRIERHPRPEPGPGQVLLRVRACGICHADVDLANGAFPFARFPAVPGHEIAATVERRGPGVTWPETGVRVGLPFLYSSCGVCERCVSGREILCGHMRVTGISAPGGYQEFLSAPAAHVTPIPEELDMAGAAPLMCAGVTAFNGLRQAGFAPGQKVAVIGMGGVGRLAVRFAVAMGARVAVVSRGRSTESAAALLGAERFIATEEHDPAAALRAWEGGAEIILATAPSTASGQAALGGLAPDGTLVLLGFDEQSLRLAPAQAVMRRNRVIGSPSGSRRELRETLAFAAAHGITPDVASVPLERAGEVWDRMRRGHQRGRAVITFDTHEEEQ